jgi:hypothetical protein
MTGRIALLTLVTGLFAAAWSSEKDAAECAEALTRTAAPSIRITPLQRWNNVPAPSLASNRDWEPTRPATIAASSSTGIPAGVYIVVDGNGRCTRIRVDADASAKSFPLRDHFVRETNGVCRHWIRLARAAEEIGSSAHAADRRR